MNRGDQNITTHHSKRQMCGLSTDLVFVRIFSWKSTKYLFISQTFFYLINFFKILSKFVPFVKFFQNFIKMF